MNKYKWFLDYTKEEAWLNSMSKAGYELVSVSCSGGYRFKNIQPSSTSFRIDYRIFKNNSEFLNYCTLFEDSGWKHICGTKSSGSQYFMKTGETPDTDIFSDAASKAGRYKRLSDMWLSFTASFMPIIVALAMTKVINLTAFIHPAELYYTPGLWDMTGSKFWFHFLFETPFAFMRGFSWSLMVIIFILYLYCAVKSHLLYKATIRNT